MPRLWMLATLTALPLAACTTSPMPGYRVSGSTVRWIGPINDSTTIFTLPLRDVDAKTFRSLGAGYAIDAKHVYHEGDILRGENNPAAFKVLADGFAAGSYRAYKDGYSLPDSNGATWRRFDGTSYSTDGIKVWYDFVSISEADGATFRVRAHIVEWQSHSNANTARDALTFFRFGFLVGTVDDCGKPATRLYASQEELDYLCNDLKLPSEVK